MKCARVGLVFGLCGHVSYRGIIVAIVLLSTFAVSAPAQVDGLGPVSGSAFVVHTSGRLVTNNHVVENCSEVTVTKQGGAPLVGRVVARDVRNDLALIAVDSPLAAAASF